MQKSQFLREKTKYLGFVINGDEIKPDMRFHRSYRRFILAFSRLATSLITLTKKYARKWTKDCHREHLTA